MKSGIQIRPLHPQNATSDLKCWLDGADSNTFTLDGTYVNNWACKGSLSADVANTNNNTTRPTYDAATGRVTFTDANGTFLKNETIAITQPNTVFIVCKSLTPAGAYQFFFDGIRSRQYLYLNSNKWYIDTDAGVDIESATTDGNDNIHYILFNGANSDHWINGVLQVSGDALTDGLTDLVIGDYSGFGLGCDAEICEVIIYDADISDVDRDKITGYLANKHGIVI